MRKSGLALALAVSAAARRLRPVAAICRRPVHAAAGRLQAAGDAARRHRRLADHRRHGRAARRLDRAGARQHHRRAPGAAGDAAAARSRSSSSATSLPGVDAEELADLERLQFRGRPVDRPPQISRRLSADQARQGARLDAWRGRRALGQKTGYDYALFLHAEDQVASTRPDRARSARRSPAASSASARPMSAARPSSIMPRWSIFKTGEVVWFNVVQAGSQLPGIKFGDLRTPAGRGADGRAAARPDEAGPGGPRSSRRQAR